MADKLKQFVTTHREDFEFDKASEGLWDAIEKDLKQHDKRRKLAFFGKTTLRVAASVVILISLGFMWLFLQQDEQGRQAQTLAKQYPELIEAEQYYDGVLENKIKAVKAAQKVQDLSDAEILLDDIGELEKIYQDLKTDLKDNVENEQIINAMIQNYRTRIVILEELLEQLQHTKKSKQKQEHDAAINL